MLVINSVFIMLIRELKIISTETDMVSREQRFVKKGEDLNTVKLTVNRI